MYGIDTLTHDKYKQRIGRTIPPEYMALGAAFLAVFSTGIAIGRKLYKQEEQRQSQVDDDRLIEDFVNIRHAKQVKRPYGDASQVGWVRPCNEELKELQSTELNEGDYE
ncbi:hypothetical protein GOV11_02395 [Candidatus Woesearchaeota archaeon]|nr:hypothetical protein [Candidatus Woesearchaeota archaeon]